MRQLPPSHRTQRHLWVAVFTLLAAAAVTTAPAARTIAPRFSTSTLSEAPLQQYRALRKMHARTQNLNHEGWMDALTELDAQGFRYKVISERGSDTVRGRVLKALLERERELVASGDTERSDLTEANYEFSPEVQGPGVRYIPIKPKRKDVLLVEGRIVLSEDGREMLRVEGKLSKNPSFWTSSVQVVRHYARIDGVRVPIATESVAKVKFAGMSHLQVDYQYEQINNRPVSVTARRTPAPLLMEPR
jgi:hypothetical protein